MIWKIRENAKGYNLSGGKSEKDITTTLLKLENIFENLSNNFECKTDVSIKNENGIHFSKTNYHIPLKLIF